MTLANNIKLKIDNLIGCTIFESGFRVLISAHSNDTKSVLFKKNKIKIK